MHVGILLCTFLGASHSVSALMCYQCSNLEDENCGLEWNFDAEEEARHHLKECPSPTTACQKYVGELQGNGEQYVYRKCWNQTTIENYTPSGCNEQYVTGTIICYCSSDGCNGSDVIVVSQIRAFVFILTALAIKQYYK